MRVLGALLASPALLAGLCHAVAAQVVGPVSPRVVEVTGGLFCAPPDGARRDAPGTMSGWIHVPDEPVVMFAQGFEAPAVLGLGFGVRFRLDDTGDTVLHYTVTHPPMPPSGTVTQSWTSVLPAGQTDSAFFQFDTPNELQPGDWAFVIASDTEVLFTIAFTVRPATDLPELAQRCQGGSLMSFTPLPHAEAG